MWAKPHKVMTLPGGPRIQAQCFRSSRRRRTCHHCSTYEHDAPTRLSSDVKLIDLECDQLLSQRGFPFGAAPGEEEDVSADEHVRDRQNNGNIPLADRYSSDPAAAHQL